MKIFKFVTQKEAFNFVINSSIYLTLVFLPIIFIPIKGIIDIYSAPRYVFLLVVTIISLIFVLFNTHYFISNIELNKSNILIIVFYIILTFSLTYSVDIYLSLYGLSIWRDGYIVQIIFLILFFLSQLINKINKNIFEHIVYTSVIVSIYGIVQSFGIDVIRDYNSSGLSVVSTMYNQNFLGTYLVLTIPFALHLYFDKNKKPFLIAYAIIFYTLLETMTRGAWLGFIFSFITYLILYSIKNGYQKIDKTKIIYVLLTSIVLIIIFSFRNEGIFFERFLSIFNEAKTLLMNKNINLLGSNRGYIWSKSIIYIIDRPIFGYGIQNILLYFISDYSQEMAKLFGQIILVNNVHNEYLQIALSTGVPSLIIYLSFIYFTLKSGIKKYFANTMYLPIIASIIGYLVQAIFSLSFITVAYIFWILLGILLNKNEIFN